ncbi:small heat shock protein [Cucumis melo var. makuwa]|uniref:Small heat shock protein, chloroplastic-like n=2 Tax=Cucumis melo TaxID=3656 RepID=A0A1S3BEA1_CUCME|nr:small heat shock protein, chloroplastic-like [Cucumis melo]KAA0034232.1 small heat shock protein [Cucumis melo var. makuwa]TYK15688.1 small heat shock protein [Cucumis melo var. makuwa]
MAQAVSNLTRFVSFTPTKAASNDPKKFVRRSNVKAVAGDGRDNLDHLQRTIGKEKQTTQPPKKRVAPVAPIGLWDRFPTARTVQQMMETMERIMDDPFAYSGAWPSPPFTSEGAGYSRGRTPWEIKEGENEYKMRFDMPGMTKNDVKVWVEEKMLVVKAEKVKKAGEENGKVEEEEGDWSAKSYGKYSSRIALPENVQFEQIKAEVKDGVLYITIPKAMATSKIVDINVQ